jgi:hypothetical protein
MNAVFDTDNITLPYFAAIQYAGSIKIVVKLIWCLKIDFPTVKYYNGTKSLYDNLRFI